MSRSDDRRSVLLADDSLTHQLTTSAILHGAGMTVDVVSDGRQALEALARRPYDIVLMDGQMPEMDGYDATREIRRRENGKCRTPVVALTAGTTRQDKERCLAAGMDDYLAKPVRPQALVDIVFRWTSQADTAPAGIQQDGELGPPAPVLDPEVVDDLRLLADGRPDFLEQVIGLFSDELEARVAELEIAVRLGDGASVQRVAHRIKGSASQVGASAVGRVTVRIEAAGASGAMGDQASNLAELRCEHALAQAALRAELLVPAVCGDRGA